MKDAILKGRISDSDKSRLVRFACQSGKSASEIVRLALCETIRGHIAGNKRREDTAKLRRSTNQMVEALTAKPIDIVRLKEIAAEVRSDASRVLA